MGMNINTARRDHFAGGIDFFAACCLKAFTDRPNAADMRAVYGNIGAKSWRPGAVDKCSIANNQIMRAHDTLPSDAETLSHV
jgi:hypothetical protein